MKEKMNMKKLLKRCAITTGIGLAITAVLAVWMGLLRADDSQETARVVSDAFMTGSALLIARWALGWVGKTGTFAWITYSFGALGQLISSLWRKSEPSRIGNESYGEYAERTSKEKKNKDYTHFLVAGVLLLAVSIIAAVAYMR